MESQLLIESIRKSIPSHFNSEVRAALGLELTARELDASNTMHLAGSAEKHRMRAACLHLALESPSTNNLARAALIINNPYLDPEGLA
jgi:hypothetical protein